MKILRVVDTRDYVEQGDRWVPVPGSGQARECDRCGRLHEVHAYVEAPDGHTMVVGTGCMGLGPEAARKYAAKAGTVARLNAEREHLLDQIVAHETAEREVAAMTPPEPVHVTKPWGTGVEVGGHGAIYESPHMGRVCSVAEATATATRHWRDALVGSLSGVPHGVHGIRQRLSDIEKRIQKAVSAATG